MTPPRDTDPRDAAWMAAALRLARRGLGRTWPNPAVGCLLVAPEGADTSRPGCVVGRGWTQPGGRPHAERVALDQAGAAARGATAYVTLEPCSHHGQTPPCADALVAAGVSRAVVALVDPDPRVGGRGLDRLRAGGVAVTLGVGAAEAREVARGFLMHRLLGRPLVTLKAASTLDGRIAARTGESRWITGPEARAYGHGLRADHDAIAVGLGTALADDPELTCRLPGLEDRAPVRVIFDARLDLPPDGRLAQTARTTPLWLICRPAPDEQPGETAEAAAHRVRARRLEDLGARLLPVDPAPDGRPAIAAALRALAEQGITRLLVEGGGRLAAAFLAAGLVDRLAWFQAPRVIGGEGIPAVAATGWDRLADAATFRVTERRTLGADTLTLMAAVADPLS